MENRYKELLKWISHHLQNVFLQSVQMHPKILQKYTLHHRIGSGGSGFVIEGSQKEDHSPVAIKCINKSSLSYLDLVKDRQLGGIVPREASVLRRVKHQHIVQLLDYYEDDQFYYIIMNHPIFNGGCDLFDLVERNNYMSENRLKTIFKQVLSAVKYLQDIGLAHLDIKDENILVSSDDTIYLADFGFANIIPKNKSEFYTNPRGTRHAMAPEIIKQEKYRGVEQDIWSLGVLLYTITFKMLPFMDEHDICKGVYTIPDNRRSPELMDLLSRLLNVDASTRITMNEIQSHVWLHKVEPS